MHFILQRAKLGLDRKKGGGPYEVDHDFNITYYLMAGCMHAST